MLKKNRVSQLRSALFKAKIIAIIATTACTFFIISVGFGFTEGEGFTDKRILDLIFVPALAWLIFFGQKFVFSFFTDEDL